MLKNKNSNKISIVKNDMYEADLSEADIIFNMHSEGEYDLEKLYSTILEMVQG